jgi:hypothetical protein
MAEAQAIWQLQARAAQFRQMQQPAKIASPTPEESAAPDA